MFAVEHFEPKETLPHRTWLFLGGRGTGKSKVMQSVLYDLRDRIDAMFLITPTPETQDEFAAFMPRAFIYSQVDPAIMEKISELGKTLKAAGRSRNFLLVIDDCAYDRKFTKSEELLKQLFNGRHSNVTLFYSTQYLMYVPPAIRDNIDYVFVGKNQNATAKAKLFDIYFDMFDKRQDFSLVLNECTKDWGFLVGDRLNTGNMINDRVKLYRGQVHLPAFRIGPRIYFDLTEKYRIGPQAKAAKAAAAAAAAKAAAAAAESTGRGRKRVRGGGGVKAGGGADADEGGDDRYDDGDGDDDADDDDERAVVSSSRSHAPPQYNDLGPLAVAGGASGKPTPRKPPTVKQGLMSMTQPARVLKVKLLKRRRTSATAAL